MRDAGRTLSLLKCNGRLPPLSSGLGGEASPPPKPTADAESEAMQAQTIQAAVATARERALSPPPSYTGLKRAQKALSSRGLSSRGLASRGARTPATRSGGGRKGGAGSNSLSGAAGSLVMA